MDTNTRGLEASQKSTTDRRLATEVLELGESLFEIALEAGSHHPPKDEEGEAFPIEELQAATQEFFSALRLLLGIVDK